MTSGIDNQVVDYRMVFVDHELETIANLVAAETEKRLIFKMRSGHYFIYAKIRLKNDLISSKNFARCSITISPDWRDEPMTVRCLEKWVKRNNNWHIDSTGKLCYELPDRWKDHIGKNIETHGLGQAMKLAALWCMRSTKTLLYYHWYGFCNSFEQWDEEWAYWKHGWEGVMQYERSK